MRPLKSGNHLEWVGLGHVAAAECVADEGLSAEGDALFFGEAEGFVDADPLGESELVDAVGEVDGLAGEASACGVLVADADGVVEVFDDEVYFLWAPGDSAVGSDESDAVVGLVEPVDDVDVVVLG